MPEELILRVNKYGNITCIMLVLVRLVVGYCFWLFGTIIDCVFKICLTRVYKHVLVDYLVLAVILS